MLFFFLLQNMLHCLLLFEKSQPNQSHATQLDSTNMQKKTHKTGHIKTSAEVSMFLKISNN